MPAFPDPPPTAARREMKKGKGWLDDRERGADSSSGSREENVRRWEAKAR